MVEGFTLRLITPLVLGILLIPCMAKTQAWQPIAPMLAARAEARAMELKDGRILVVGGKNNGGVLTECEIYDPQTTTWRQTGSLSQGRYRFELDALDDGRVLAMGGLTDLSTATTASCEIFNPLTETWKTTAPLPVPSENIAETKLPNGHILAVGGLNANVPAYVNFAVSFDPNSETFTRYPDMPISLDGHSIYYAKAMNIAVVASGLFGGFSGYYLQSTQLFNFDSLSWSFGDSTDVPHDNGQPMTIQMPNETPLLVSGRDGPNTVTTNVAAFNIFTNEWTTVGHTIRPHWHCSNFLLGQDSILLVGGAIDPGSLQNVTSASTWFRYSNDSSWVGPAMNSPRDLYAGVKYAFPDIENPCEHSEIVYVFGGQDGSGAILSSSEILNLGLKANSAEISLSPSSLSPILLQPCQTLDTVIGITAKACSTIWLDSIVSPDNVLDLMASLALPLAIAPNNLTAILLKISLHNSNATSTAIRLVFSTPVGRQIEYIHVTISPSNRLNAVSLSNTSLLAVGTICQTTSRRTAIQNKSCDTLWLDSVTFSGSDGERFVSNVKAGSLILPSDSLVADIELGADTAREYSGQVHFYYHQGPRSDTLSATLLFTITGIGVPSAHAYIKDITTAYADDTTMVPVEIVGGNNTLAQGLRLHLTYNKDLLLMLEPDYLHSLDSNASFDDINQTPDGVDITIPSTVNITTGTLMTLRFASYVTTTSCTTLKLTSLLFSPDDPAFTTCILQANLDSATICLQSRCGDNEIREHLSGKGIAIDRIKVQGDKAIIEFTSADKPSNFEIYDILGRAEHSEAYIAGNTAIIDIGGFSAGPYFVRMNSGGLICTRRFVK